MLSYLMTPASLPSSSSQAMYTNQPTNYYYPTLSAPSHAYFARRKLPTYSHINSKLTPSNHPQSEHQPQPLPISHLNSSILTTNRRPSRLLKVNTSRPVTIPTTTTTIPTTTTPITKVHPNLRVHGQSKQSTSEDGRAGSRLKNEGRSQSTPPNSIFYPQNFLPQSPGILHTTNQFASIRQYKLNQYPNLCFESGPHHHHHHHHLYHHQHHPGPPIGSRELINFSLPFRVMPLPISSHPSTPHLATTVPATTPPTTTSQTKVYNHPDQCVTDDRHVVEKVVVGAAVGSEQDGNEYGHDAIVHMSTMDQSNDPTSISGQSSFNPPGGRGSHQASTVSSLGDDQIQSHHSSESDSDNSPVLVDGDDDQACVPIDPFEIIVDYSSEHQLDPSHPDLLLPLSTARTESRIDEIVNLCTEEEGGRVTCSLLNAKGSRDCRPVRPTTTSIYHHRLPLAHQPRGVESYESNRHPAVDRTDGLEITANLTFSRDRPNSRTKNKTESMGCCNGQVENLNLTLRPSEVDENPKSTSSGACLSTRISTAISTTTPPHIHDHQSTRPQSGTTRDHPHPHPIQSHPSSTTCPGPVDDNPSHDVDGDVDVDESNHRYHHHDHEPVNLNTLSLPHSYHRPHPSSHPQTLSNIRHDTQINTTTTTTATTTTTTITTTTPPELCIYTRSHSDLDQPTNPDMLPSSSTQPNHCLQLAPSPAPAHSKRSSYQSSAPSLESDDKLWPRQNSSLGEASSCPSDNEISSLYGKYGHSGYSSHDNTSDQNPEEDADSSLRYSFTEGDDANGLPVAQSTKVLDELKWMLGEAIDSAHSTFDNQQEIPPSSSSSQPSRSPSEGQLLNRFDSASNIDQNELGEHLSSGIRSVDQSPEDLSELLTASSASDYSDGLEEDSEEFKSEAQKRSVDVAVDPGSSEVLNEVPGVSKNRSSMSHSGTLKRYSVYGPDALTNNKTDTFTQDNSKLDFLNPHHDGNPTAGKPFSVYSEEILLTTAFDEPELQCLRRSASQTRDVFSEPKRQGSISSRKRDTPLKPLRVSNFFQSVPGPNISTEELTPMNSPLVLNSHQSGINVPPSRLPAEDESSKLQTMASPTNKSLTARSPLARRTSSDATFLEQWQWLEAQHPHPISSNHKPVPMAPLKSDRPTSNTRQKCIQILNDHFTSASGAIDYSIKMNILSQRQQALHSILQRPSTNKSMKTTKPISTWVDRVPTIKVKELKALKSTVDRCRMYDTKLQQLHSYPLGLDLWVWLKTRSESSSSCHDFLDKTSFKFCSSLPGGGDPPSESSLRPQARKPSHPQSMNHQRQQQQQSPLLSTPVHPKLNPQQQALGDGSCSPSQIRDLSVSSFGSFPLRAGNSQKAIQIKRSVENQLVEIVPPEGLGHRPNGMVVNSLMEVDNLPYPGLYPHSVGHHHQLPTARPILADPPGGFGLGNKGSHNYSLFTKPTHDSSNSKPAGRFFSQITRQNSSRNRHHGRSSSSSPCKSNLVISAPMISGPITGPRGPRPAQNGSIFSDGVTAFGTDQRSNTKLFNQHFHNKSMVDISQQELEEIETPIKPSHNSPLNEDPSHDLHLRSEINATGSSNNSKISKDELVSKKSDDAKSYRHQHHNPVKNSHQRQPWVVETGRKNVEMDRKVEKLMDILPQADRSLLEKVLIDSDMDDMVAIGNYLELHRRKEGLKN